MSSFVQKIREKRCLFQRFVTSIAVSKFIIALKGELARLFGSVLAQVDVLSTAYRSLLEFLSCINVKSPGVINNWISSRQKRQRHVCHAKTFHFCDD